MKKFDEAYLTSRCKEWLNGCMDELKKRLENVLKYAVSLKSLSLIKDAVIQFEASLNSKSDKSAHTLGWSMVCDSLFKTKIELWSHLVSPFYYSQSKVS